MQIILLMSAKCQLRMLLMSCRFQIIRQTVILFRLALITFDHYYTMFSEINTLIFGHNFGKYRQIFKILLHRFSRKLRSCRRDFYLTQGSYRPWKVLEFYCSEFQAWKVLEKGIGPGKSWNSKAALLDFVICGLSSR